MNDYFKTIDELSIETILRFIETQDIRKIAAREMLSSRVFEKENKIDLKFSEMGLGDSKEFKGV